MKNEPRPRLTLLSRGWCHLCDEMRVALERMRTHCSFDLQIVDIDVDGNAALERLYGEDIPVLLAGDQELCRHRLDPARIAAYLEARAPAPAG